MLLPVIDVLLTAYGSGLGAGYADGYGGGAMKGSAYAAKAPGPYGGMKLCCVKNVCD